MDVVSLAIVAVLLWLFARHCVAPFARFMQLRRALSAIPCPERPHWLLGHLPVAADRYDEEGRVDRWVAAEPRIMRIDIVVSQEIVLVHPDTAAKVLRTAEPKSYSYSQMHPWLGDGLFLSAGKRWARDRRLLTRGFHFDILRGYLDVYKQATAVMLEKWARVGHGGGGGGGGKLVNISKSTKYLTLDITLRCIMSYESNCQSEHAQPEMLEYAQGVLGLTKCLSKRYLNPLQHFEPFFKLTANGREFYRLRNLSHRVSEGLIKKRRQALADVETVSEAQEKVISSASRNYLDFLDILLTVRDENGQGLTDREIQEQVETFLFAGHDTTATGLQWTLYLLAKHPELQEKCRQEVRETLNESKEVCYDHLNDFHYLTQFIKESLRIYPPVPYIGRSLTKPMTIDDYHLPEGTSTFISILGIHRNPAVWERPNEFDPDRFSEENLSADRSPFAFIPFSAGPRNCIGQSLAMDELKTVIAQVLLRFRLTLDDFQAKPILMAELVSRSKDDIKIYAHEI